MFLRSKGIAFSWQLDEFRKAFRRAFSNGFRKACRKAFRRAFLAEPAQSAPALVQECGGAGGNATLRIPPYQK